MRVASEWRGGQTPEPRIYRARQRAWRKMLVLIIRGAPRYSVTKASRTAIHNHPVVPVMECRSNAWFEHPGEEVHRYAVTVQTDRHMVSKACKVGRLGNCHCRDDDDHHHLPDGNDHSHCK